MVLQWCLRVPWMRSIPTSMLEIGEYWVVSCLSLWLYVCCTLGNTGTFYLNGFGRLIQIPEEFILHITTYKKTQPIKSSQTKTWPKVFLPRLYPLPPQKKNPRKSYSILENAANCPDYSSSAKNLYRLEKFGVTHVLNTAQGTTQYHVNTDADYYKKQGIKFLGISALDEETYKLNEHWEETADFIDTALKNGGEMC